MPAVNPEVLVWARESAGLSTEEAARKLSITAGAGRLAEYEAGTRSPSTSLLNRMVKAYRRPLIAFYLAVPPPTAELGQDFRNLPQRHTSDEPLVNALLRDVRARQSLVRAALEEDQPEGLQRLPFISSMTVNDGVGPVVASMRAHLGIDRVDFRARGSVDAAFSYLRTKVEEAGVFVLLIGNLGTFHTNIEVSAFRGFALADDVAPFIVINDQDARAAWSFTLLHELVHLWVGATGVSGPYGESLLEKFCNDVASEFLVPALELQVLDVDAGMTAEAQIERIGEFARQRLVSRALVAYRLFRANRITREQWELLTTNFRDDFQNQREARREAARERDGGPNYYVVRRHRLGGALLRLVDRSVSMGILSPTKASKVLGVNPRSVAPLLSSVHRDVA